MSDNFETSVKNNKISKEPELIKQNASKSVDTDFNRGNSLQGFLSSPEGILQLQKSAGNQAVLQLFENEKHGKSNKTGLPDSLKSGIENLSGIPMDSVNVHYNSSKPSNVNALAYTQGTDIHVGPGQEKHLPHEAWHVVQQKQGRVKPTKRYNKLPLNDSSSLEREADIFGAKALQTKRAENRHSFYLSESKGLALDGNNKAEQNFGDSVVQLWPWNRNKKKEDNGNEENAEKIEDSGKKDAFGWLDEKAEKDKKTGLVNFFNKLDEHSKNLVIHVIAHEININDLIKDKNALKNAYVNASKDLNNNNNNEKFKENMRSKLRYLWKMDWCKWDMFSDTIRNVKSLVPFELLDTEGQEQPKIVEEDGNWYQKLGSAVASNIPIVGAIKAGSEYIGNTTLKEKLASDSLVTDNMVSTADYAASGTKTGMNLLGAGATAGAVVAVGTVGVVGGTWALGSGVSKAFAANKQQNDLQELADKASHDRNIKLGDTKVSTADIAKTAARTKGLERDKGVLRATKGAVAIAGGALALAGLAASPAGWALLAVGLGVLAASLIYKYYKNKKKQKQFVDELLGTNAENREETLNEMGFNSVGQFYNYHTNLMAEHIYKEGVEGNNAQYETLIENLGFNINKEAGIPNVKHILKKLRG